MKLNLNLCPSRFQHVVGLLLCWCINQGPCRIHYWWFKWENFNKECLKECAGWDQMRMNEGWAGGPLRTEAGNYHPDWEAEGKEIRKPDPSEPWNCGRGGLLSRMNGHSCHHRKQNECGRNMPSFFSIAISCISLLASFAQKAAIKTAQECGGHGPHTEHRKKGRGKGKHIQNSWSLGH